MSQDSEPILLTGASGYVGGRLLDELRSRGARVRALVRDASKRRFPDDVEVVEADVAGGDGLAEALDGARAAVYLVHSMGNGNGDFAARDRRAARTFGDAARAAGTPRTVYLGGLGATGEDAPSEHLRSRHEVAELLGERVPSLVYARAAMVIGAGSASFEMLRYLVQRLPAMITPRWIETRTQPVAVGDVVGALAAATEREDAPAELQLGGAEVLAYGDMLRRCARVTGRREPLMVGVPFLSPRLSSYWVSLVTPVDTGLVRPLVDGLSAEMVVERPPPPGFNDDPLDFDAAVRAALRE